MLQQWTGRSNPGRNRILGRLEPELGDVDVAGAGRRSRSWPATVHIGRGARRSLDAFVEEECGFEKTTWSRRPRAAVGVCSIAVAWHAVQGVSTATGAEGASRGSRRRGSRAGCRTDKIVRGVDMGVENRTWVVVVSWL